MYIEHSHLKESVPVYGLSFYKTHISLTEPMFWKIHGAIDQILTNAMLPVSKSFELAASLNLFKAVGKKRVLFPSQFNFIKNKTKTTTSGLVKQRFCDSFTMHNPHLLLKGDLLLGEGSNAVFYIYGTVMLPLASGLIIIRISWLFVGIFFNLLKFILDVQTTAKQTFSFPWQKWLVIFYT